MTNDLIEEYISKYNDFIYDKLLFDGDLKIKYATKTFFLKGLVKFHEKQKTEYDFFNALLDGVFHIVNFNLTIDRYEIKKDAYGDFARVVINDYP